MESGPRRMYQSQTAVFNARSEILGKPTDSTPTTPPSVPEIDLDALCKLKREVVSNLPLNCFHCGAEYPKEIKGTFVELNDGSVMAYCKKQGACGRSHVLFAGVELVKPVYEQVCVFTSGVKIMEFDTKEVQPQDASAEIPPLQPEPLQQEITQEIGITPDYVYPNHTRMTNDQMMEMHNPTCAKCGQRSLSHKRDIDQNGWRVGHKERLRKPAGWPVYNSSAGNWSVDNEGTCAIA